MNELQTKVAQVTGGSSGTGTWVGWVCQHCRIWAARHGVVGLTKDAAVE